MILRKLIHVSRLCSACAIILFPATVSACATCFGKSDSKLAHGMNMGILSLLVVVGCVLAGIAAFFIYLARRSAATSTALADDAPLERSKNAF